MENVVEDVVENVEDAGAAGQSLYRIPLLESNRAAPASALLRQAREGLLGVGHRLPLDFVLHLSWRVSEC